MTRPTRRTAGLVGLVLMVAAGPATVADARVEPRLTRAELLAEADAVCAAGFAEAEALRAATDPTATGRAAARQVDAALVVLDEQVSAFAALRGPKDTDRLLTRTVARLRRAATGLRDLREVIVADRSTVDGAIRSHPGLVARINAASTKASEDLVRLGFLGCVAAQGDTGDAASVPPPG